MISSAEALQLFREHLPDRTVVRAVAAKPYVDASLKFPFIRRQVELGIYDLTNIYTDFLSAARVYAPFTMVDVCFELFQNQFEGLTERQAEALLRWSAVHEARHLTARRSSGGVGTSEAADELACNAALARRHPDLHAMMNEVQYNSVVFQRVYARISRPAKGR